MDILKRASGLRRFERPGPAQWAEAERALGVTLPGEFKEIVSAFGTGLFGNLTLYNPAAKSPFFELLEGVRSCATERRVLKRGLQLAIRPPEPEGYLRLGRGTDRWDVLWRPGSGGGGEWIWLSWEFSEVTPLPNGLGDFLTRGYERTHTEATLAQHGRSVWHGAGEPDEAFFHTVPPLEGRGR